MHSVDQLAVSIARSLQEVRNDGDRLRLVRQYVMDAERATKEQIVSSLCVDPVSTGSDRWDLLLAGLAEWVSRRFEVVTPLWASITQREPLIEWWFVNPFPKCRPDVFRATPKAFANRGVFLTEASLINV